MTHRCGITVLCLAARIYLGATACVGGGFGCDQEVQTRAISPDGKHIAMVLSVQCGATTSDATWVLVTGQGGGRLDAERDGIAVFQGRSRWCLLEWC